MKLNELDYWRLCDHLNLAQVAALITGNLPSEIRNNENGLYLAEQARESSDEKSEKNAHFEAVLCALTMAIKTKRLPAQVVYYYFGEGQNAYDLLGESDGSCLAPGNKIDPIETTVYVFDLRDWLETRRIKTGFFFPIVTDSPDYLDPQNLRYAPKLAAAVRAWQTVIDPGNKSAKQALEKWLREHAAEFGLVDDDGNPVNQAIEDCSKVANWNQSGGAPKTPGG